MVVALLERRLRENGPNSAGYSRAEQEIPSELAEIFKHEVNRPRTGNLGKAELLVAHGATSTRLTCSEFRPSWS